MKDTLIALMLCIALFLASAPTAWGLLLIKPAIDPNDDPIVMGQIFAVVNEIAKEFPAARGTVVTSMHTSQGFYAAATRVGGKGMIFVNDEYTRNPEMFRSSWEYDVSAKFHPPLGRCTPAQALAYHESAHLIDFGGKRTAHDELVDLYGSGMDMHDELSRYSFHQLGMFNEGEALAEAFASVRCNGGNHHEQQIYELLTT